jgi:hypothetical protein
MDRYDPNLAKAPRPKPAEKPAADNASPKILWLRLRPFPRLTPHLHDDDTPRVPKEK